MYQLKDSGFLTQNVVSFYFRKDNGSIIKFGSYDKEGLNDPSKFYIFKTNKTTDWAINLSGIKVKNSSLE